MKKLSGAGSCSSLRRIASALEKSLQVTKRPDLFDRAAVAASYGPFCPVDHVARQPWRNFDIRRHQLVAATATVMRARERFFVASELAGHDYCAGVRFCRPLVAYDDVRWRCGHRMICPFCWGRKIVRGVTCRVQSLLGGGQPLDGRLTAKQRSYAILTCVRERQLPIEVAPDKVLEQMCLWRRAWQSHIPFGQLGATVIGTIEPDHGHWRLQLRILAAYREAHDWAPGTVLLRPPFTAPALISQIARVCSFPASLIAPPADAFADSFRLLAQRSNFRLLANYGIFRGFAKLPWAAKESA